MNNLGSTCIDNVTYQVSRALVYWFWRRFFKVFTIYGHGGHVDHVTQLICINFHSHSPLNFQHTFVSPSAFSRRTVVSYWRKYVHEVLVNRLGGLSLPRKSVVRLTDRPDMTLDVYRGRKTTIQPTNFKLSYELWFQIAKLFLRKTSFNFEI